MTSAKRASECAFESVSYTHLEVYKRQEDIRNVLRWMESKEGELALPRANFQRVPHYCSDCPHNTSTKVPEGSRALAGIGCHYMVTWMNRDTDTFTHMGGEGVTWAGQAAFTETEHVFQTVSYTHLDVYKRQVQDCIGIRRRTCGSVKHTRRSTARTAIGHTSRGGHRRGVAGRLRTQGRGHAQRQGACKDGMQPLGSRESLQIHPPPPARHSHGDHQMPAPGRWGGSEFIRFTRWGKQYTCQNERVYPPKLETDSIRCVTDVSCSLSLVTFKRGSAAFVHLSLIHI